MRDKNLLLTIIITFFLFSFVSFLIYLIYCYAYYNPHQEKDYIRKFNTSNYAFVYDNLKNNKLPYEDFLIPLKLMYTKKNLTDIYDKYYKDSHISKEDFLSTYYFGENESNEEDFSFVFTGETTLFKRRHLKYDKITVRNSHNKTSTIAYLTNINISKLTNSTITIDNNELTCTDTNCTILSIYGGLHELIYKTPNTTYYALVNFTKSKEQIDVSLIDNLIKIS